MFSDKDPAHRGRDSLEMLRAAVARVHAVGYAPVQVDATVVAESPRLSPYRDAMRQALGESLGIPASSVGLKGKTNEGMGWIGRGEGIACVAVAVVEAIGKR
jgi:2-C-methyl-D-erythritol 2,4-cyclodiphosphate synthase